MVQGRLLVSEAVQAGIKVRFVLARLSDGDLLEAIAVPDADKFVLDDAAFDRLNDTSTPQGVLALCDIPEPSRQLGDLDGWLLVADGITDPGNLGTILRSAEASGAAGVVVTAGTVDPFGPKCIRASAGACFYVPVYRVSGLAEVSRGGYTLVGTTSHPGPRVRDLWSVNLGGRVAIVMGNESAGMPEDAPVEYFVTVPHQGRSESLNVAMAATVIATHVGRASSGTPKSKPADERLP